MLVVFCHCDRLYDKNNSVEQRLILAPGFRGYSSWLAGSVVSGSLLRQDIMAKGCGGAELFTSQ